MALVIYYDKTIKSKQVSFSLDPKNPLNLEED